MILKDFQLPKIVSDWECAFKFAVIESEENKSSHQTCSMKEGVLKNFKNSQENTRARDYFLLKLQAWRLQLY